MGIDLEPYLDPSADRPRRGRARSAREYAGPALAGLRPAGLLQGVPQRGPGPAARPRDAAARRRRPRPARGSRPRPTRWASRDRVVFLGDDAAIRTIVPYYLAADAFWFPSNARSEAFGLVQVEAMACGCPVINAAIPHSGVPWVSPHEETGLTVPVDDPAALAAAANRLLDEPGLRDRLGAAGREPGDPRVRPPRHGRAEPGDLRARPRPEPVRARRRAAPPRPTPRPTPPSSRAGASRLD